MIQVPQQVLPASRLLTDYQQVASTAWLKVLEARFDCLKVPVVQFMTTRCNKVHTEVDRKPTLWMCFVFDPRHQRYRKDSNETAFAVAAVKKIDTHNSLTFNDTVPCEVISMWNDGLKEEMDTRWYGFFLRMQGWDVGYQGFTALQDKAKRNVLGMKIVRDQSGNTLRVLQSRVLNRKLIESLSWADQSNGSLKAILLHMVALLSTEAEYMTLMEAVNEDIWLKGLATESIVELWLVVGIATNVLLQSDLLFLYDQHATAEDDLDIIHTTPASNSEEILAPKNDISEYIKAIKSAFDSMEDGVISPSAYDTAWVALIKDVNGPGGGPQFPSSLQWVVNHQLRDGLEFVDKNLTKLKEEKDEHMNIGFEIIFPGLIELAQKLEIKLSAGSLVLKEIYARRDLKLAKITKDILHKTPRSLLYSLEGMNDLEWERLLKLLCRNGSFMCSPAPTSFAFMQTKDQKCLAYLTNLVAKFNGGGIGYARYTNVPDVDDTAMGFRVLRMHGYQISTERDLGVGKPNSGPPSSVDSYEKTLGPFQPMANFAHWSDLWRFLQVLAWST
ncbi:copalyl pyrophosphate synthase 1 [Artemisia annua]|uniref:Copalyl pyrophosphate synthase 1 n=1 Tax=Artemisia annua TaxID=35608 RepID=A0A2U1LNQ0_ARTAN|nr:copalyl pyrophosphate synthase 1 [Artemisia annua]